MKNSDDDILFILSVFPKFSVKLYLQTIFVFLCSIDIYFLMFISILDEEDKEKASDKWERREIEKINRAQRLEKKKEESKRIRKLVDNAYNCDPRIIKFRKAEFDEKAAKKKAKADAVKARKEEEERLKKEAEDKEKREKEEAEKIKKAEAEVEKKEREAHKKLLKVERKKLRTIAKV